MSVNDLLDEVLQLPPSARESLVEKIIESIAADIAPAIEQRHLDEIRKRRQQAASGVGLILAGDDVLRQARNLLKK